MAYCAVCGRGGDAGGPDHGSCAGSLELDPPRYCSRCGRRLDVQVFPTGYRATCRRCDGVHPASRDASRNG